MSVNGVSLPTD